MDLKGIEYLRTKLSGKRTRIDLRYKYYEMKHFADDFGISTPPDLRYWMSVLGWCAKAVDTLADRLVLDGFKNDTYGMAGIYEQNNMDVLFDSAILGALITSCNFIYITYDADGFPLLRVIDGMDATGIIDPITSMLKEGYAVLDRDDKNQPILEAYFVAGRTDVYENGEFVRSSKNPAPYPLLVPVIYRPDAKRPFGHSRISRACMSITDSTVRTVKRSEIAAEFYSYPQKYILGMDASAERMDKWKASMSSLLRIDKDEDGDKPTVGQFQTAAQTPHTEQLREFAGLFAGETGLTLDDLGFPSQNPSSSEAIKARKAQRDFSVGFLNAGYLAACVRDGQAYKRSQIASTRISWAPIFEPDVTSLSGIGDAIQKIQTAFPEYFTENKLKELTGI